MNGRSTVSLLALAALVSVAFAGCIEAPSFLTSTDAEATARENKDLADAAAAAWDPAAKLVGVSAFEASGPHAAQSEGKVPVDATVGNGRALLWLYAYQTANATRVFRVEADGRIQVENTSMVNEGEIPRGDAATSWTVDSDAAMLAARADAVFHEVASREGASVVNALGADQGAVKWALVAITEEKVVVAIVDAVSGERLLVETVDPSAYAFPVIPGYTDVATGPSIHLEGKGSLDASERTFEQPFEYAGHGDDGLLVLKAAKRLPGDMLWWSILDADGEAVADGGMGGILPRGSEREFEFTLEKPGSYTFVLEYYGLTPLQMGGVEYAFTLDVGDLPEKDDG